MTKILIMPNSIKMANEIESSGVILGIKGLSINMPFYCEIKDLEQITASEIFICLNKNMHNNDLEYLKEVLLELNSYKIKGVIFYDIALVNLKKKLDLNYDLVWGQEHLTTNYVTSNFWFNQGVNYTLISNDITLEEIKEFKKHAKAKLMLTLFGYIPIFASKRHLVKNYLKTFELDSSSDIHYMENDDKLYPVIDNEEGTIVYSDYILEGLREYIDLDINYVILNSFKIEGFEKVVAIFSKATKDNIEECEKELQTLFGNLSKGFLYQETIYRVKKNEK